MDKYEAADKARQYKSMMPSSMTNALMLDLYVQSRENNMCEFADPFCTDNGMYEFPAGVNAGSGETGPDYDCLYTTPNPAWYYMRIGNPGAMNIHMYSTPQVDIDFCCWGPFDDPTTPCPYGLTEDKVVSCSYSTSWTENCMIPATAQTGEYYILVITNYSNQTCNINFSMPMEGTAVSTITVDVPANQNAWVDFDLTTPVSVSGSEKLWVVWTANTHLSNWPAGCTDANLAEEGTWWNPGVEAGYEWEHETYGTWTMRQYFTNRSGEGFYSYASENAPKAVEAPVVVKGAPVTPEKGKEVAITSCVNPNAAPAARYANGNRSLNHYRVYRTNCYQECPFTEENTVLLATVWVPDTVYIDVEWADLPAGVYKWGVGAVYEGNRGELIEAPINWAAPVVVDNNCRVFEGTRAPENNSKPVSDTEAIADYTPARGNATVILTAGDVWGDGSGYQMLLDANATAYGTVIPETGALSTSCSGRQHCHRLEQPWQPSLRYLQLQHQRKLAFGLHQLRH